jgi:hypothetical protein
MEGASRREALINAMRPGTSLRRQLFPEDVLLDDSYSRSSSPSPRPSPYLRPTSHIIPEPDTMLSSPRKFSYASVKEDPIQATPQSFASSLSSEELEEVEWIAWPCSQWCRTKGLCSHHSGGTHDDYIQSRLEGYARSNPRKLQKILQEIEKRHKAQKNGKLPTGAVVRVGKHRSDSGLEIWREKLRKVLAQPAVDDEVLVSSDDEEESDTYSVRNGELSTLEMLPNEIQDLIFSYTTVDHTADPYARPHTDLCSLSLVSKSLHAAALRVMYRHVSIPQSKSFTKFLRSLTEDESLGQFVQCLDFSHYSNIGFGRTRTTSTRTPFLTPTTIKECLDRLPQLQAFLVHEHIDDELDVNVFNKLFNLPQLQALDLLACSSKPFNVAITQACASESFGESPLPLKRLSLHECTTLQEPVFKALLPRLTQLTHLDVAHTLINDEALHSIPHTARITHLNLERCTRLTGAGVVRFLTTHPAVKDSIVYLNIMADASRHRLLTEDDLDRLLPALPRTARSLNIGGARINPSHVSALRKVATHVEELGLRGANLGMSADINRLFTSENNDNHQSAIHYLDLSDIKSVTQMSLSYSSDAITGLHTAPLEVIEVGGSVLEQLKRRSAKVKDPEWVVRELGRRGWYVRQPKPDTPVDNGARVWKEGANWWGARKVPVFAQDVSGMMGWAMFKNSPFPPS